MSYCQQYLDTQQFAIVLPAVFSTFILGIALVSVTWSLYVTRASKSVNLNINKKHSVTIATNEEDGSIVLSFGKNTHVVVVHNSTEEESSGSEEQEQEEEDHQDEEQEDVVPSEDAGEISAPAEDDDCKTNSVTPAPVENDPNPTPEEEDDSESKHTTPHAAHCCQSCKCKL